MDPHAFRHARAVSLLRSGVPLKVIGDVLGHTSAQATAEYLKLATEDLRAVVLELPWGVAMTRVAPLDAKLVERFVRIQPLRHPVTPKNYAGTLRNFNSFVTKHGATPTLCILRKWLKERSRKWPANILHHRTLLVARYLGWLHDQEVIASNPFTERKRVAEAPVLNSCSLVANGVASV